MSRRKRRSKQRVIKREACMQPYLPDWERQKYFGRYHPDFSYVTETHTIILEVDEWAHRWHKPFTEMVRMVKIRESIGKPTLFIRFNTDKFHGGSGGGKYVFNEREFQWRAAKSMGIINSMKDVPLRNELQIVWLYYDRFTPIVEDSYNITTYQSFIDQLWERLGVPNRGDQGDSLFKYIKMSASSLVEKHKKTKILENWLHI